MLQDSYHLLGIFAATEDALKISICPRHRDFFGIHWRCNKKMCSTPIDWAPHKSKKLKGDRGLTFLQSKGLYQLTNQLLHVGTRKQVLILRQAYRSTITLGSRKSFWNAKCQVQTQGCINTSINAPGLLLSAKGIENFSTPRE